VLEGIGVTYDALGRAVEAAEPQGAIEFLYGPGGGKLAVMSGQTLGAAYIPLPGGGTAVYHGAGLAYYRHADGLGSSRLASTPGQALYSATAYAPYGEPHEESGTTDRSFTGQNQDITGGQYDFLEREFNPIQGRWWTPDPAGLAAVDPNNPQSWNRYAYVNGRPLGSVDPLGLMAFADGCIPVASNDSGKRSNANAEANGDFGPYEPDGDGAAASSDDDYSGCAGVGLGGSGTVLLDGAEVDGLGGDLIGMGGGWGGGGPDSLSGAYACAWSDCLGAGGGMGPDGPLHFLYDSGRDGCRAGQGSYSCQVGVTTGNFPRIGGGLASCGLGPNQPCSIAIIAAPNGEQVWSGDGTPLGAAPPLSRITSSVAYSRSYVAFLACEYLTTFSSDTHVEATLLANIAPWAVLARGNLPGALWALAGAAVWDIGGAWEVSRSCSDAIYGPAN